MPNNHKKSLNNYPMQNSNQKVIQVITKEKMIVAEKISIAVMMLGSLVIGCGFAMLILQQPSITTTKQTIPQTIEKKLQG